MGTNGGNEIQQGFRLPERERGRGAGWLAGDVSQKVTVHHEPQLSSPKYGASFRNNPALQTNTVRTAAFFRRTKCRNLFRETGGGNEYPTEQQVLK
jgi:hypothetical protein